MQLDPNNLLDELEEHMMKTEESLAGGFNTIRTGKASPSLVENIMVEYYGTPTRLKELARHHHPGTPAAGDPALGQIGRLRGGEGDSRLQHRHHSDERRHPPQTADPGIEPGAARHAGQAGQGVRGRGQGRAPEHPPGRKRRREKKRRRTAF